MELRHLRYFVVVAEELNLTRASEKLFIAQPPLTRQIRQLEDEVGAPLFHRHSRGLVLTEAGQYFLDQARQILGRIDAATEDARRIAQHGKTIFGIGFVPSVFYGQLPMMVRRLRRNQNLEIVLEESKTREQVEALKAGRIDIGFGRLRIDDPNVEQEVLSNEPMLAALPASHPLAEGSPSMAELSGVPMLTFPSGPGPNLADLMLGLFHRRGLRVNVVQQVNDVQTALSLVASELGFTLVPEQVQCLHRDGVCYVPLADDDITIPVIASRRRGETPSAIMRLTNTILDDFFDNRLFGRDP
ncbi:LysR family transcriptional regulator [uncultured Halovibrio sp.]|uniref:LysR family transcriptional regulator n=1 Tax=uncultured Halovibrio sp. TaxID=985049 RepID=UPI0025E02D0F|nr:LysR family transcriptional regulator [uncultured Halovibrio sp.]